MATSNYVLFDIGETQPQSDLVLHPEIEVDVFDPEPPAPKKTPRFYRKEGGIEKYAREEIEGLTKTVGGMAETAASMLSGWAGMVPAGFQGLGEKIYQAFGGDISDEDIAKHIGQVQDSWTYEPRSETGKIMVDAIGETFEKGIDAAGNRAYKKVYEKQKKMGKSDFDARKEAIKAEGETRLGAEYLMAVMPIAGVKGGKKGATEQPTKPGEPPSGGGGTTPPLEGEYIPRETPTQPKALDWPPLEGEVVRPELPPAQPKLPSNKKAIEAPVTEAPYTVYDLEGPAPKKALPSPEKPKASVSSISDASVIKADKAIKDGTFKGKKAQDILTQMKQERLAAVEEKLKSGENPEGWDLPSGKELEHMRDNLLVELKFSKTSVTDPAVMERKRLAKETEKNVSVEDVPVEEISMGRAESAKILEFKDKKTKSHEQLIADADSYLPDLRDQKARAESPEVANAIQSTINKIEAIRAKAIENLDAQKAKLKETSLLDEGDALHKTESSLNAELNANKITDGPDVGLSIKRTVEDAPSKVEIPDKAVETFFKETKGEKKPPLKERATDFMESLWHKMSRTYEHLPNTGEFAELKYSLKLLEKSKGIVSDRTIRLIDSITYDLGPNNYDVFRKKLVLDDLHFTAGQGKEIPRGFTKEQIAVAKQHIDQSIANNPKVVRALEKRKQVWDAIRADVIKVYNALGINVDNVFSNPDYFRHLILDKARAQMIQGTGSKLKTPRGRSYTRQRKGSELDFNTEYIQAEYEVLAGLLNDINIAKTVKLVHDKYNIRPQLEQQFGKEWSRNIPDGYSMYKSDPGHALFLRYTIPESIAEQMFTAAAQQLGIPKDTIQKNLTLRRDSPNMIVKDEIAITLDNLIKTTKDHPFVAADKKLTRAWKVWTLTSPRRLLKYNMRNITGDAEAAFIGNPSTFTQLKIATIDVYDMMALGKAPSETLKAWLERGGMQSTLQAAELGDINKLALFKRLQDRKGSAAEIPEKMWQGYWKAARLSTDFREAVLRYAAFRDYIEQMKRNPDGMPDNYGASIREEVRALPNMLDRADKLANDLLGNYTEISVAGQTMRDHIFPFWSFQEINFRRYFRFVDNALQDGKLPELMGRKLVGSAAKTPFVAARVGILAAKMATLWTALEVYNHTFFADEEEELPNYIQDGPHVILGRNEDGSVDYFGNLGILGDFVTWFGFNAAPGLVRDWYAGRKGITEIARDMAKEPVNKMAGGAFPFAKLAYEEVSGVTVYPNVFEPKHIRDKSRHLAKFLGLEKEYDALADRPSVPYYKTLPGFLYYSVNSGEAAYSNIYELKKDFLIKIGKGHEGYIITPASNALYNFKLAVKYKDKEAADKYMQEYAIAGGNIRGLATSLRNMHPLAGIPEERIPEFAKTLSVRDAEDLQRALTFYQTTLNPLGLQ